MAWVRWIAIYAVTTVLVARISFFPEMRISHGVLMYLLIIVGASREGSRVLSAVIVVLSYLAVDYFFVPPRLALGKASDFDIIIMFGFVLTAFVIAQLVLSLRQAAVIATARAVEIERLSAERIVLEREASRAAVLQEAERLKNALLASVSHDLRSPIMAMTMLADPVSGLAPAEAMARISEQARQLGDFLSTLGRFTSVDGATGDALRTETHVVDDLVGAAIRASASQLTGHTLTLPTGVDGAVSLVRCDFTLSLQVMGNLLQNAAKYAPVGGIIEVSWVRELTRVRITVSDRGAGIPAGDVERLFHPMQRGAQPSAVAGELAAGTGMGLAIARTFARAQLGDVTYRPRPGGGACFDLLLPAAPEAEMAQSRTLTPVAAGE